MNVQEFGKLLARKRAEIDRLVRRQLPVRVGDIAKAHYQNNFRLGGFVNDGFEKWPEVRRRLSGRKGAGARYGPLLSGRNHLFSSVKYTPSDYRVKVANDLLYAPVHNWGGETHPTVTPRMRKFAWAMYYKTAGIRKRKPGATRRGRKKKKVIPEEAKTWRNLALTRKRKLNVKVPKRQFLGESRELNGEINNKIESEIRNLIYK